jgi:hypothetical protein
MKRRKIILSIMGVVLVALLATILVLSPSNSDVRASVVLLGITNDATGQKFAILRFTNPCSVQVAFIADGVDYKLAQGWLKAQSHPASTNSDWPHCPRLHPHQGWDLSIPFPTNGTWRYRIECVEQNRGIKGVRDRVSDLKETITGPGETTTFSGRQYSMETGEIK